MPDRWRKWLAGWQHMQKKMCRIFPEADPAAPGAGAAGGLGFALSGCLHAVLTPGAALIMERTGLAACIDDADFVVTGEGCLDAQTAMGKAPAGVAALATTHGVPVIALAGSIRGGHVPLSPCGGERLLCDSAGAVYARAGHGSVGDARPPCRDRRGGLRPAGRTPARPADAGGRGNTAGMINFGQDIVSAAGMRYNRCRTRRRS